MATKFKPTSIIIHCSASRWGDAKAIEEWHKTRGFDGIGYHAVILNGYHTPHLEYAGTLDGKIEPGRALDKMGAHCKAGGMNTRSLSVCLIGVPGFPEYFTDPQRAALVHLLATWCKRFGISAERIYQHSDFDKGKPLCASVNLRYIRQDVAAALEAGGV